MINGNNNAGLVSSNSKHIHVRRGLSQKRPGHNTTERSIEYITLVVEVIPLEDTFHSFLSIE
jgi:hypothetical protein